MTRSKVIPTTTKTIKINFHDAMKQPRTEQKYHHHNLTNRKITELYALKAGVTAIAYPSEETIEYAKIHNYRIDYHSHCCAQIYLDYI